MKNISKLMFVAVFTLCMISVIPVSASATTPGLADVISGQETKAAEAPVTTEAPQPSVPVEQPSVPVEQPTTGAPSTTGPAYSGGLVDVGGLSSEDLAGYAGITQNPEAQNTVQSTIGQVMGWVVPILVGIIFGALTVRILLDILYLVAPFLRDKLAPGAQGGMGDQQMQGGMQGGMGGMQGGMGGGYGMSGGMGGGYGMSGGMDGGYGGRRGGRGGMQQQQGMPQGKQWVSESALAAVAATSQMGPNGKPFNPFTVYAKSMIVPLVLVPVLLILLLSGVLTNVGFYLGDLLSNAINSKLM